MSEIQTADTVHAARIADLWLQGRAAELVLYAPEINGGGLWDNPRVAPPRHRLRPRVLDPHLIEGAAPGGVLQGRDELSPEGAIPAIVNHGRWVVVCPCGGAQVASRVDPRYFCTNCLNSAFGGMWRPVVFPSDADAIEAVLSRRDYDVNRNWQPPEMLADLIAENEREGVR